MFNTNRDTGSEAYRNILQSGLLGKRQQQIYDILYRFGPLSSNEIWAKLKEEQGVMLASHGAGSRLSELREMGCVSEVGDICDPITKMRVTQWDITGRMPTKLAPKPKKDEQIAQLKTRVAELEAEVAGLKAAMVVRPRQLSLL